MWQSSDAVTSSWESGEKHSERIGMAWPAQTKAPLLASLGWNRSFSSAKWNLLMAECLGTAKLHPATEICVETIMRKMCSTCIPIHADSGLQIIQFQVHTYVSANFCAYAEPKVKTPNGLKTHKNKSKYFQLQVSLVDWARYFMRHQMAWKHTKKSPNISICRFLWLTDQDIL